MVKVSRAETTFETQAARRYTNCCQRRLHRNVLRPRPASMPQTNAHLGTRQLMRSRQAPLQQDAQLQRSLPHRPLPRHCRALHVRKLRLSTQSCQGEVCERSVGSSTRAHDGDNIYVHSPATECLAGAVQREAALRQQTALRYVRTCQEQQQLWRNAHDRKLEFQSSFSHTLNPESA